MEAEINYGNPKWQPKTKKKSIRDRFIGWLERLFGIDHLRTQYEALLTAEQIALQRVVNLECELKEELERNKRLSEIFEKAHIGIDVHMRSRSWAVVCLGDNENTNTDAVYFFQFPGEDMREIQMFLKHYNDKARRNAVIDAPYGFAKNIREIY